MPCFPDKRLEDDKEVPGWVWWGEEGLTTFWYVTWSGPGLVNSPLKIHGLFIIWIGLKAETVTKPITLQETEAHSQGCFVGGCFVLFFEIIVDLVKGTIKILYNFSLNVLRTISSY